MYVIGFRIDIARFNCCSAVVVVGILTLKRTEDRGQKGKSTGFDAFAGMTLKEVSSWIFADG